jgi:glycosyltransferase involved in cell wall biosynthesis
VKVGVFNATPLGARGGGEVTELQVATHLQSIGFNVKMYSDAGKTDFIRLDAQLAAQRNGVDYTLIDFQRPSLLSETAFWTQPVPPLSAVSSHDVSFIILYRLPPISFIRRLSVVDTRVLFGLHGLAIGTGKYPNLVTAALQRLIAANIDRFARNQLPANIYFQATTEVLRSSFVKAGLPPDRISVIPSGADFNRYRTERVNDAFRVAFVGRSNMRQKGLSLLVGVVTDPWFAKHPEVQVDLLGSGPDDKFLEQQVGSLSWVHRRGYVGESEKQNCLAGANLLLVTSYLEPFSLAAIEGLASGLPIVSTPTAGPLSTVGSDSLFGAIVDFNVKSFIGVIDFYYRQWLDSREGYYKTKHVRRERARARFDLPSMLDAYENRIRTLAFAGPRL